MKLHQENLISTGLSSDEWQTLIQVIAACARVERVVVFGSRAQGNFARGSDVDLALIGSALTHEDLITLAGQLNDETPLPYRFDLVAYAQISHAPLKEHINAVGLEIARRD
jgi:predicted nucleotidyltransferase